MKLSFKTWAEYINLDRQSLTSILLSISILLLGTYPFLFPKKANATVTEAFVRFDRLATTSAVSGTACFKTGTTGTETNVVIVFPIDWTISSTPGNWTVSTTTLPVDPVGGGAASAWPGIGTATSVVGTSVVFPGTDLTATTFYCFNFAGASSTLGAAGNDKTGQLKTQGGSPYVDSVNWATSIVAASGDQITVTASVSATFTFSLSGSSVSLGTLSSSTTASGSGITQTVGTNARNGWVSWIKGAQNASASTGSLYSAVADDYILSPGSHEGTPETLTSAGGYAVDADAGTGAPTIAAEYNGASADAGGHVDYSQFRQTASKTGPVASDTVIYIVRARSSALTQAGTDYTDTLTVTAAGSF